MAIWRAGSAKVHLSPQSVAQFTSNLFKGLAPKHATKQVDRLLRFRQDILL